MKGALTFSSKVMLIRKRDIFLSKHVELLSIWIICESLLIYSDRRNNYIMLWCENKETQNFTSHRKERSS
jgi:hypothetical protein